VLVGMTCLDRMVHRRFSPVQLKKGGWLKRLIYNYAYWRKLWFIKAGAPPENVRRGGFACGLMKLSNFKFTL
jgi:hypothetical protein